MTLATILVGVDFDAESENRVALAAEIAGRFDALLIGVAGWTLRKQEGVPAASAAELRALEPGRHERILQQLEQLGEKFRRIAAAAPQGTEWRSSTGFPKEVITAEARAADLVVIGQEGMPDDVYHTYDPATIILAAGRPVLVVPAKVSRLESSRILIAWKDTRESRRAVFDALPFLKRAQSVIIAAVNQHAVELEAQVADVARYLARHRVPVGKQIASAARADQGHALLDLAREYDAGLIVAGAYGHSRLGEWIFGGVTRDLILQSSVPCLFSN